MRRELPHQVVADGGVHQGVHHLVELHGLVVVRVRGETHGLEVADARGALRAHAVGPDDLLGGALPGDPEQLVRLAEQLVGRLLDLIGVGLLVLDGLLLPVHVALQLHDLALLGLHALLELIDDGLLALQVGLDVLVRLLLLGLADQRVGREVHVHGAQTHLRPRVVLALVTGGVDLRAHVRGNDVRAHRSLASDGAEQVAARPALEATLQVARVAHVRQGLGIGGNGAQDLGVGVPARGAKRVALLKVVPAAVARCR
ncbi:MAG: hypothetical protein CL844_03620 [Crocinitomicaceae bacterium]|nr:hypothetical protein [Crocinitomicaceae bacterium]